MDITNTDTVSMQFFRSGLFRMRSGMFNGTLTRITNIRIYGETTRSGWNISTDKATLANRMGSQYGWRRQSPTTIRPCDVTKISRPMSGRLLHCSMELEDMKCMSCFEFATTCPDPLSARFGGVEISPRTNSIKVETRGGTQAVGFQQAHLDLLSWLTWCGT